MLKFDSTDKIALSKDHNISEFFSWLPHSNNIIVVKKVIAVSKAWGQIEIDLEKIRRNTFKGADSFPADYGIELLAQSIGMIGAAQAKLNLVKRGSSSEAYVTGLKDFNFSSEHIDFSAPVFAEVYETRVFDKLRFCNVKLYRKKGEIEELLISGVMKTYTVERAADSEC